MLRSATTTPGAAGMIASAIMVANTAIAGARTNTALSAKGGIQSSLESSLIMSATT